MSLLDMVEKKTMLGAMAGFGLAVMFYIIGQGPKIDISDYSRTTPLMGMIATLGFGTWLEDKRASAIIRWENNTLWLQGQFFGKPVNVMVKAQTPLKALEKLPQRTWGHANKLVVRHIMPNITEIAENLVRDGEYKVL